MTQPAPARTRNAVATRRAILHAARGRFLSDGYDQVGLRSIAADAGCDPALICRYFGSKDALFAEVLASTIEDTTEVFAGDRAKLGERLASAMLDRKEHATERMAFIELATRSSASPVASKRVRQHLQNQFIAPFVAAHGGEQATEKAWLAVSVLMGVAVINTINRARPTVEEPGDATKKLAHVLQTIVDQR